MSINDYIIRSFKQFVLFSLVQFQNLSLRWKGLDQSRTLNPHLDTRPPPTKNFLTSSRQPRRVKFDLEAHFNPTKRNLKKKIWVTWPPSPTLILDRVKIWDFGSKHPRRLKFDIKAYFNQTKRNLKNKIGVTWHPPTLTLNRVKLCNLNSKHHRRRKFNT